MYRQGATAMLWKTFKRPQVVASRLWSTKAPSKTPGSNELQKQTTEAQFPQAPNRKDTWSAKQMPRSAAMTGPRFETVDRSKQPAPAAAIELTASQPIIKIHERIVACDGGHGALGHPRIYINLDQGKPISCTYCGLRYQQEHH